MPKPNGTLSTKNYTDESPLIESEEYLQNKFGDLTTVSYPGLDEFKILNNKKIPGGDFEGMTMKQALQSFNNTRFCLLIFGSNDWLSLIQMNTETAVRHFLQVVSKLFNLTNFKVVILTTLIPRKEMYRNNKIHPKIVQFNSFLLSTVNKNEFQLQIQNRNGRMQRLHYRVADLQGVLPYEKISEMYCQGDVVKIPYYPDKVHLQGEYMERVLEQMFQEVWKYLKK